jgi:hypothetical protein
MVALSTLSGFRRWRRQVSSFDYGLKSITAMRTVAERFVCGIPAAAKRNYRATCKAESVSGCVFNRDVVADYAKWAVIDAVYCCIVCIAHQFSPLNEFLTCHCIARAACIESKSKINALLRLSLFIFNIAALIY